MEPTEAEDLAGETTAIDQVFEKLVSDIVSGTHPAGTPVVAAVGKPAGGGGGLGDDEGADGGLPAPARITVNAAVIGLLRWRRRSTATIVER